MPYQDGSTIADTFQLALQEAAKACDALSHAERSARWVGALAARLKLLHAADSVAAFCRSDSSNRPQFRINELLFDILVAQTRPVKSANGKDLLAVSRALWVVESELNRSDSRDVLIDLNKLVVAQADNKVLAVSAATPLVGWAAAVMAELLDPIESDVYLVTIPHPEHWSGANPMSADVYQLLRHGWIRLSNPHQPIRFVRSDERSEACT